MAEETGIIRIPRSPRQFYDQMPLEQKQCRARRFHILPDLNPGASELPDGYRITGLGRKLYEIEQQCQNGCGLSRFTLYRFERGKFRRLRVDDRMVTPKYHHPEDWVTTPFGVLNSVGIMEFILDDSTKMLLKAAKESALAEDE